MNNRHKELNHLRMNLTFQEHIVHCAKFDIILDHSTSKIKSSGIPTAHSNYTGHMKT